MTEQTPTSTKPDPIGAIDRPVVRRSMLFAAAGAVIGLAIAGYALFTAQGTRTAVIPPENAALVNNIPILRADMIAQTTALYNLPYSQATHARPICSMKRSPRRNLPNCSSASIWVSRSAS